MREDLRRKQKQNDENLSLTIYKENARKDLTHRGETPANAVEENLSTEIIAFAGISTKVAFEISATLIGPPKT